MNEEQAKKLREPFPRELIGKLPPTNKRPELDFVGHGAVTDRLLDVDYEYGWEPFALDPSSGLPQMDWAQTDDGPVPVGLWMKLTIAGVTRPGYGSCPPDQFEATKVLIGDALRNAAMRFGVALDLWIKGEAEDDERRTDGRTRQRSTQPDGPASPDAIFELQVRAAALPDEQKKALGKARHESSLPKFADLPASKVKTAKALVNSYEAQAKRAGADLDAARDAVMTDLTLLAGAAALADTTPPDATHGPDSDAQGPEGSQPPAEAPGATEGPSESAEDRAVRKALERMWKQRTAELVQHTIGLAEQLPDFDFAAMSKEVDDLAWQKVNAELDVSEDEMESPIEHRRWLLKAQRLAASRHGDPLADRGEASL